MTLLDEHGPPLFAQSKQEIDTLRWAAPESLAIGNGNTPKTVPTKESDIYSFGGIMLQVRDLQVIVIFQPLVTNTLSAGCRADIVRKSSLP